MTSDEPDGTRGDTASTAKPPAFSMMIQLCAAPLPEDPTATHTFASGHETSFTSPSTLWSSFHSPPVQRSMRLFFLYRFLPTATHITVEPHATLLNSSSTRVVGSTGAWSAHELPFQRSASVEAAADTVDAEAPTEVHAS